MRPTRSVRLALWLLDRMESVEKRGDLSGDLLEELEGGRPANWFWHQVAVAILIHLFKKAKHCAALVAFAMAWSALFPIWRAICVGGLTYSLDRFGAVAWPWSSILPLCYGVCPAVLFVWLGFVMHAVLSRQTNTLAVYEQCFALSTGAAIILASSLTVLRQLSHPQMVIADVTRTDFFLIDHFYFISVPIAFSLCVTLWLGGANRPNIGHRHSGKSSRCRMSIVKTAQMLAVAFVLCSNASTQSTATATGLTHGTDEELIQALRTKLAEETAAGKFSGVVFIAKDGVPLFKQAYGFADRERKPPNTAQTCFRLGSINKVFTAVATLQLAEAGKIKLDDPLVKYLPDYPNQDLAQKVTIRELLNHTGGTGDIFGTAPNQLFSEEYRTHRLQLTTLDDYIHLYGDRSLRFVPGSRFEYSNYGYILLGKVIEKASGENYYDYMRKHVYRPIGMQSTGEFPVEEKVANLSIGYTSMDGSKASHPNTDLLPYRGLPAGMGYSTAEDLFAFAKAFQQNKLLDPKYTSLMMTGSSMMPRDGSYGYGLMVHLLNGNTCVGHAGGYPGMNADIELCNNSKYILVVLANVDPPVAQRIGFFIANWITQSKP